MVECRSPSQAALTPSSFSRGDGQADPGFELRPAVQRQGIQAQFGGHALHRQVSLGGFERIHLGHLNTTYRPLHRLPIGAGLIVGYGGLPLRVLEIAQWHHL